MKRAYPNFSYEQPKPIYNLNKWLEAMRTIFTNVHFGKPFKEAFGSATSGWEEVEKFDFKTWLDYYQSNNHNKYKKANFYVNDNISGYFVPNSPNKPPAPIQDMSEPVAVAQSDINEKMEKEERRKKIEEQRKKIIGRLHAAVKHLTSHEGHLLAGEEFDKLLTSMYDLIKQFQTVNKISLSNQMYYDLIIRQANKLSRDGFKTSSNFLHKFAQNTQGQLPLGAPIPAGSDLSNGSSGGLGNNTPSPEALITQHKALDELLNNLETAGLTDKNFSEDDDVDYQLDDLDNITLEVEAQLAPQPNKPVANVKPAPVNPMIEKPVENLEVSLPEENEEAVSGNKRVDDIINDALSAITVQDVIKKLESVISIFRSRQLSRELMFIDMMLNRLGLISLFPELGESNQKILESSGYVLSRLEKIISQLSGTVSSSNIELDVQTEPTNPTVQSIKDQISSNQEKDKKSREIRKQLENKSLMEETKPIEAPAQEISQTPAQVV